jgi:hypothetical protein
MSRFLQDRHYKLIVVGVLYYGIVDMEHNKVPRSLRECIQSFLNETSINYTQEDVEAIEIAYKRKYGKCF